MWRNDDGESPLWHRSGDRTFNENKGLVIVVREKAKDDASHQRKRKKSKKAINQ